MECYFLIASCPPGQVSQSGLVPCVKCPPGYNQTLEGQKFCYNEDGQHVGVECLQLPCLNGGSCHSLGAGVFQCECNPGFIGRISVSWREQTVHNDLSRFRILPHDVSFM